MDLEDLSDNTEQTKTPKTRSEYLHGKTELSDVDIIHILDLPVEKRSINNEIYTDKSYKELKNNPEELSSLTENLKAKPEYLKYHSSYIAKSKLLYQESDVLCNEIPCLMVLNQLKKTSYLLPYEYASNKSGAVITSADALKSNTFTDFKRVFNSRLKKLIEKGITQGKDIFFLINNKKLSHDEIKSQLIRFLNNRTSENKEGTYLFFSEKNFVCYSFESDKNGFITELPEYDLKEIRAAISSKPLTPSRESEKTSDSLASNLNITQEKSDVNELFSSLLLRGEITLLERKKDIENRNERYLDAVTSLEKLTPLIQSDSIKESNNKFVKKQKESRFYKDVQNLFVKTKTSNKPQENKKENTSSENISYENEEMRKAAAIKERNQQKKLTTQMILDQEDKEQMENISAAMKSATKDFMDLNATPITEERTMKSTENFESQEYWKNQFQQENADTFKAIDDYLDKGIRPKGEIFSFFKSPEILKFSEISENTIQFSTKVINKARNTHNLTNEEIKSALINIASPVLIFDSDINSSENKENSVLLIANSMASSNKPLAITLNMNVNAEIGRKEIIINEIRSIHDRTLIAKNGTDLIQKWTENGLCRYVDDKKISEWSKAAVVQFPLAVLQSDKTNILSESNIVNGKKISEWQLAAGEQFPLAVLHSDRNNILSESDFVNDKKISNLVKEREDSFLLPLAKLDKHNVTLTSEIVNGTDYPEIRTFSKFAEQQKNMEKEYQEYLGTISPDEESSRRIDSGEIFGKLENQQSKEKASSLSKNYAKLVIDSNQAARIKAAREIKENMPSLSENERTAAIAILEAGAKSQGMEFSEYVEKTFPDGIFGDIKNAENAAKQQGVKINGAVSVNGFGENVKAVIYAGKNADFSTWCHELSHIWQAQIAGELKNDAEEAFQVKDSDWQNSIYTFKDGHTDTSAEAFAYGFEDFLKHKAGEMATEDKKAIFEKFADYMSRTYNGIKQHIEINEKIASVYQKFVELDDNILAQAEKAVRLEIEQEQKINEIFNSPNFKTSQKVSETIGLVSDKFAALASQYRYDIKGYSHTIDNFFVNHALKQHGDKETEEKRGNVAITYSDICNVFSVYTHPDYIVFGTKTKTGNPAIVYVKNIGDSTIFVEDVRRGKKELAAQTLYKKSGTIDVSSKKEAPELYAHSDPESISIVDVKKEFVNESKNEFLQREKKIEQVESFQPHSPSNQNNSTDAKNANISFQPVDDSYTLFQLAYHGSSANFDKFNTSEYGLSGDGAMAFGYGVYVSNSETIARSYAGIQGERNLYTVEIPDGDYIIWNKTVSKLQKEKVKNELYENLIKEDYKGVEKQISTELNNVFSEDFDGKKLYGTISSYIGSDKETSKFFKDIGFSGIEYTAGTPENAVNYVIFDDNDIKIKNHFQFQIIGELGARELDRNAESNERIANLETAKRMEEAEKDANVIRLATGWEKGADGKWKYEIDDSKVHFNLYDAMEEWDEMHPRYEELREKFFKTELSEEEQKEFAQWVDERNEVSDKHTDMDFSEKLFGKTFRLPEVMRHNELFKAYPELKYVTVSIKKTGENGTSGNASYEDKHINLYRHEKDTDGFEEWEKKAGSVLLHEVQHIIQGIEGFAKGASPEMFEESPEASEQSNALAGKIVADGKSFMSAMEAYRASAGEVESRNVQTRMRFTPKQRINTLLSDTADIAPKDQIVMFDVPTSESRDIKNTNEERSIALKADSQENKMENISSENISYENEEMSKAAAIKERNQQKKLTTQMILDQEDKEQMESISATMKSATKDFMDLNATPITEERIDFLKTPTGNKSELSENEWKFSHSSEFKKLYGDWEGKIKKDFLLNDDTVSKLTGDEFSRKEGFTLTEQVEQYFNEMNNSVESPFFGKVVLDREGADDSLSHGMGRLKAVAYAGVPNVIKNGVIIDSDLNHKDRGYNSYVIAAPIKIADKNYICEVVLKQNKQENRFYLHEVTEQKKFLERAFVTNPAQKPAHQGTLSNILEKTVSVNYEISCPMGINGEPEKTFVQNEYRKSLDEFQSKNQNTAAKITGSVSQEENPFKNADPDQTKELYEQAEAVEKMQQEAAANAVLDENGNTHYQTDEELLQEYKQKYPESSLSISEDTRNELENVFSQIDDYLDKGIVPQERRFTLPKVSSYLKQLGSDETAISLPVSVIKKARETHGLSNEEIKNSLTRLYDPVAVFDTDKTKSENKLDSKLILTDEFSESKPIALALNTNTQIQVEENGHRKFIEVQDIRSIHDRTLTAKNGTDLVKHWTENGLCRYVDDKKISEWSTVARVSFPIEALHSDKNNILTKSEVVNPQNSGSVKQEEERTMKSTENFESQEYWKNQFQQENADTFKAIDDYLEKGIRPKNDEFIFEKVPEILKAANVSENEIVIKTSIINKAKNEHSLSDEEIKDSIKNIASPVLIFNSDKTTTENKKESFLCLTDTFAENEKPIAFSMNLDSDYEKSRSILNVNQITSIHDRTLIAKNGTDLIQKWTENGLCRYVDDKKISEWQLAARVQFPLAVLHSDINNINLSPKIVNGTDYQEIQTFSEFAEQQKALEKEYQEYLGTISPDEESSRRIDSGEIFGKLENQQSKEKASSLSKNYTKVAVGVAPTIQTLRTSASSTALRASTTLATEETIAQATQKSINEQKTKLQIIEQEDKEQLAAIVMTARKTIKESLAQKAEPLVEVDFSKANYDRLFPFGIVQTPLEKVKLGENQFEKLDAKDRKRFLLSTFQTLATPDLVIDEKREGKHSHNYIKSFVFDEKTKTIQDVVVNINGENVSITAHPRDINNIVNKIKMPDQLVYAAARVGQVIEQRVQNELGIVNPTRDDRLSTISVPLNKEYNENFALSTVEKLLETEKNAQKATASDFQQIEPALQKKFDKLKAAIKSREEQDIQDISAAEEIGNKKQAIRSKSDIIRQAGKDFLKSVKEGIAPFFNAEDDFQRIIMHPQAIINASNGLPFSGESQLLAQIYHQRQRMEGEVVTSIAGAKAAGTIVLDTPESRQKNFALTDTSSLAEKNAIVRTRYFMPESCEEPDKIYAHTLQRQRPDKIRSYRDLIRHFENIPNGQKEISDIRIRIAHEHLKEIQSRFAIKEKRVLSVDEIEERKNFLRNYFERLPADYRNSERSAFEDTFGIQLNSEKNLEINLQRDFKDIDFAELKKNTKKSIELENRKLSDFIEKNTMEDKKLATLLSDEYKSLSKEEKMTVRNLKIEAIGIKEPETFLGKYLAACNTNAEFITDKETVEEVKKNLVKKLEENFKLEKYDILKEIGQQAQSIGNETTKKISFEKAHSNNKSLEKTQSPDKEISLIGMGK